MKISLKKFNKLTSEFKIPFIISILLFFISILFILVFGLKFDIDFKGGTVLEVSSSDKVKLDESEIKEILTNRDLESYQVRIKENEETAVLEMPFIEEDVHQEIILSLKDKYPTLEEHRFEKVGSIIGRETKRNAVFSISLALLGIVIYLGWAFKKVSKGVTGFRAWHYGLAAILTLIHDLVIVIGLFSVIGKYFDFSAGIYFLIALLTILGYSVNDTIVVFDRLRENLIINKKKSLIKIMHISIRQTFRRSIHTSFTTLLVLITLFFMGGQNSEVIKYFSLTLIAGIIIGTYSSIFISNSILYLLNSET